LHFDAVDSGIVLDRDILEHDLPLRIGRRRKLLDDCNVLAACGREDIEVGQHLRAVDADVEHALPSLSPIELIEVQTHDVIGAWRQTGSVYVKLPKR
jgi:hypothetical protein